MRSSARSAFEILKTVGSLLVKGATHNPVYGVFAVVVGLLVWINYLSRFTLFVAAWTVTAPFDTDVRPSGTADPAIAEDAGMAVDHVTGGAASGTERAKAVGYVGMGMLAAGAMGLAWSGAKTVRDVMRR